MSEKSDKIKLDRDDDEQDFVDQSKIDFDPDDGLYSGTAVQGGSEIPGPHLDDAGEMQGLDEESVEKGKQLKEEQEQENAERAQNQGSADNKAQEGASE